MRRLVLSLAWTVALVTCAAFAQEGALPRGLIALDGGAAPTLKLTDMDGESFDLRDARGHWAFVHFWASWCQPCRREMPTIQRMASRMEATSLKVVLVNTAETDDTVFGFLGIVAPELPTLMDRDGLVTERWQPRGLPSTFLVDPSGRLRFLALGGRDWDSERYLEFLHRLVALP